LVPYTITNCPLFYYVKRSSLSHFEPCFLKISAWGRANAPGNHPSARRELPSLHQRSVAIRGHFQMGLCPGVWGRQIRSGSNRGSSRHLTSQPRSRLPIRGEPFPRSSTASRLRSIQDWRPAASWSERVSGFQKRIISATICHGYQKVVGSQKQRSRSLSGPVIKGLTGRGAEDEELLAKEVPEGEEFWMLGREGMTKEDQ
jgi:hypothetical protein